MGWEGGKENVTSRRDARVNGWQPAGWLYFEQRSCLFQD
jgi:hypothetical protein